MSTLPRNTSRKLTEANQLARTEFFSLELRADYDAARKTANQLARKEFFSLAGIATRWGCSHGSVLSLVYSGELVAIDISTNPAGRSRYIVRAEDLEEFETRRTTLPVQAKAKRRTRERIRPGEVTEFIQ